MAEDGNPDKAPGASSEPADASGAGPAPGPAPKPAKAVPKTKTGAILRSSRRLRAAVILLAVLLVFGVGIAVERNRNKPKRVDPYAGLAWGSTSTYVRGGGVSDGSTLADSNVAPGSSTGQGTSDGGSGVLRGGTSGPASRGSVASVSEGPDPCLVLTDEEVSLATGGKATHAESLVAVAGTSGARQCTWTTAGSSIPTLVVQVPGTIEADAFASAVRTSIGAWQPVAGIGDSAALGERSITHATGASVPAGSAVAQVVLVRADAEAMVVVAVQPIVDVVELAALAATRV